MNPTNPNEDAAIDPAVPQEPAAPQEDAGSTNPVPVSEPPAAPVAEPPAEEQPAASAETPTAPAEDSENTAL